MRQPIGENGLTDVRRPAPESRQTQWSASIDCKMSTRFQRPPYVTAFIRMTAWNIVAHRIGYRCRKSGAAQIV
jgi:hypothetical protein